MLRGEMETREVSGREVFERPGREDHVEVGMKRVPLYRADTGYARVGALRRQSKT